MMGCGFNFTLISSKTEILFTQFLNPVLDSSEENEDTARTAGSSAVSRIRTVSTDKIGQGKIVRNRSTPEWRPKIALIRRV
jgi:hypothetical protein